MMLENVGLEVSLRPAAVAALVTAVGPLLVVRLLQGRTDDEANRKL